MYRHERKRDALLILEDCSAERNALHRALLPSYHQVFTAGTLTEALAISREMPLSDAVLDLALPDGSSIDIIPLLRSYHPSMSIVVVTGFGSYASAVEAIKLGARDFIAKPVSFEQILSALDAQPRPETNHGPRRPVRPVPLTLARVEWEHINRVLAESSGNISEAARRLGMQRQSLQRKLRKLAPRSPTMEGDNDGSSHPARSCTAARAVRG